MRRSLLLVGVAAAVLALSGCVDRPEPSPASASASGPPPFPRVPGDVVAQAERVPGDWTVRVRVSDAATAYARARALLVRSGYHVTNDAPARDGGNGQACTTAWCVTFTASTSTDDGPSVDYEVFHSSGVAG